MQSRTWACPLEQESCRRPRGGQTVSKVWALAGPLSGGSPGFLVHGGLTSGCVLTGREEGADPGGLERHSGALPAKGPASRYHDVGK